MSTETKAITHTSGPWSTCKSGAGVEIHKRGSIRAIAILPHSEVADVDGCLISAAPELLEVLKEILNYEGGLFPESRFEKAVAAVRKAEGRL